MRKVPADAPRTAPGGDTGTSAGMLSAWARVAGTVSETAHGFRVDFACPRCEDVSFFHSARRNGAHPIRCFCDATLAFVVDF